MTIFLNVAIPDTLKFKLGWAVIAIAGFNILTNLIEVIWSSVSDIIQDRYMKKLQLKAKSSFELMIQNRLTLVQKFPDNFDQF